MSNEGVAAIAEVEIAPRAYRQSRFELPEGATEIVLVRHGESIPAVEGVEFPLVDGHGDPELAEEGRRQAERVAERLVDDGPFTAIYVTNLRRTLETATPLAERLGLEPRVEANLREVFLGEWEGGTFRRNMIDRHPLALEMVSKERWDVIAGAESNEALAARLTAGIENIAAAHRGERVVAVSHGGAIGLILAIASGARPFSFVGADNGSISRLVVTEDRWMVRCFNDVSHLRK